MTGAETVSTGPFHQFKVALGNGIAELAADHFEVFMFAVSLQIDFLSVQQDSVSPCFDCTDAEPGRIFVDFLFPVQDAENKCIEISVTDLPEMCISDCQDAVLAFCFTDFLSVFVKQFGAYFMVSVCCGMVADLGIASVQSDLGIVIKQ
jgi:hypothetical protein